MGSPKQSVSQKVAQARIGRLSDAEIQHLKRLGVSVPPSRRSPSPIERLAAWWETASVGRFRDLISVTASSLIILGVVGWGLGRPSRQVNETFITWHVVQNAAGDRSGVSKIAVERLLNQGFSLVGMDLSGTTLYRVDLEGADLSGANLQNAILVEANLEGANLIRANLEGASLSGSNLQYSDLDRANLAGANLSRADLAMADLTGADLMGAKLHRAELAGAKLNNADLDDANLERAELDGAVFCQTRLPVDANLDADRDCGTVTESF